MGRVSSTATADQVALADFALASAEPPAPVVLRTAGLAAYAYVALPPEHPMRSALRTDYLAAVVRHSEAKQDLLRLLRAWRAAGVVELLFGDFYLAEFVYPEPGTRACGVVDMLFRREALRAATDIARELGWAGETRLALHVSAPPSDFAWGATTRISAAVWAASREREWEGGTVREMDPRDAVVVGLVLRRAWGAAGWAVAPGDALDVRLLCTRFGLAAADLRERARELGCAGTVATFLDRCDVEAGRLTLAPPRLTERLRWAGVAARERWT